MLDKLIDFLISVIDKLLPFTIINQTSRGVRLRFGKYTEILNPGLQWKIPFFDEIINITAVWTTLSLTSQSLTTKDQKDVVVKAIVKYKISDIEIFALEVWDAIDAISDMTQGIVFEVVRDKTWEELQSPDLKDFISKKARKEAKRWGIEIETVTLSDLAKITSIRLLNDAGSLG